MLKGNVKVARRVISYTWSLGQIVCFDVKIVELSFILARLIFKIIQVLSGQ